MFTPSFLASAMLWPVVSAFNSFWVSQVLLIWSTELKLMRIQIDHTNLFPDSWKILPGDALFTSGITHAKIMALVCQPEFFLGGYLVSRGHYLGIFVIDPVQWFFSLRFSVKSKQYLLQDIAKFCHQSRRAKVVANNLDCKRKTVLLLVHWLL